MRAPAVTAATLALLALSAAARAEDRPGPVRVQGYSGIFADNYSAAVVKPAEAAIHHPVEYVGGNSSAAMLGQLRTQKSDPQLDVIIMDTTTAAIACAEGLVEPVTPAQMPVLDQIARQARDAGGNCGPGVTFDNLVMVYDSQAVQPAPTAWKDLLQPRFKGKVGISAPPNIQGLALTGILATADSGNWQNADGAFRDLKALAPSVQTFDPQPDGYSLVLNGTLLAATGWNARAQLYHDQSQGRLGVLLPKEGSAFQINTINVIKGAPHHDAAMAFMAYALSAPAQKAFTERMFYAPTNTTAEISPAAAKRTATSKEDLAKVVPINWDEMIKLRDKWNQRWRREVIAASSR